MRHLRLLAALVLRSNRMFRNHLLDLPTRPPTIFCAVRLG